MKAAGICIILLMLRTGSGYMGIPHYAAIQNVLPCDNCISLIISNIKNNRGVIRIGMYASDNGYPDTPDTGFTFSKDTLKRGLLRVAIPVKSAGKYAFSVLDDENGNGKMDYVIGIIPKEGFGFSNNPRITIKAPTFSETAFTYEGGTKKVEVSMVYK